MTQSAQPVVGLLTKIYIQTTQGTAISISAGSVTGGTLIGGLTKITPPKHKWDSADSTVLGQASPVKTHLDTLVDPGECMLEGLNESADAGQTALLAAYNLSPAATYGRNFTFMIVFPIDTVGGQTVQGDQQTFTATVTSCNVGEAEPGKIVPLSATLKLQTIPVYTPGS